MRPDESRDVSESIGGSEEKHVSMKEEGPEGVGTSEGVDEAKPLPEAELDLLRSKLEKAEAKAESYLNRLKYLQADFDNYRKQMSKSLSEISSLEREQVIVKFLNVRDDIERALKMIGESSYASSFREGLAMVLKNMTNVLAGEGVKEIDVLGKPLDPEKHEVVGFVESLECEEDTVVDELRKGYLLNGRVIRPSLVKVARKAKVVEAVEGSKES